MKRTLLLLAALLAHAGAWAATTYQFTSAPYKTPMFNHTDACANGTCADFTTAMVQSGSFTLNTPLGPNLTGADVSSDMTAYSFSDGATAPLVSTSPHVRLMRALISTDAAGNITASDIIVIRWQTANHGVGGRLEHLIVGGSSTVNAICATVSSPGMCTQVNGDASTSQAALVSGGPGWVLMPTAGGATPVPVDNPFALLLTGAGLLGIALRGRRELLLKR